MNRIQNPHRAERLMWAAIQDLGLDLRGINVLTEAASGPFAVTCLMAALAGAPNVLAVTRDSPYGSAADVAAYVSDWASALGVAHALEVTSRRPADVASSCSLVTNLGFVRPLDASLIACLPPDAAISLMFEPWEFRSEDIDLAACRARDVPVAGTCETHPRLQIFRYVGMTVLKLLMEAEIEVFRSTVIVIGSDPFGAETQAALEGAGANVLRLDPLERSIDRTATEEMLAMADAVALIEYRTTSRMIGRDGIPVDCLAASGIPLIHLCGAVDHAALEKAGVRVFPPGPVRKGFMKVTTAYVGPRPVIDLHAGGLKVGELLVRGRRAYGSADGAIRFALADAIALPLGALSAVEKELNPPPDDVVVLSRNDAE